ncbi:hypothetical protein FACS1894102_6870 [Spirochaetia bacterium]|nr:hypothetical protein FACS1894102_6870 [Spirochaetia bacterium]
MPLISEETINEVQSRLDAVAVISDYVQLEKKGGRFWGRCPFHNEKTPSFTVDPDKKSYYCFGCHVGGNIVNFLMELDKINFPQAIEKLAKRFGVPIIHSDGGVDISDDAKSKHFDEIIELYRRVAGTFHYFLWKHESGREAKEYVLGRGISEAMIKRFNLGFSPPSRSWLYGFLRKKGYSDDFLASSGLFSKNNSQSAFFAGRLMFPISDRSGRVLAFGARLLQGDGPKYLNSGESQHYKKRETLFAIDLALPAIRKTKEVILVEGYMDVIALHQGDVENAVAPLGTAFTEEQAKLLGRWVTQINLLFDQDEAGQNATVKAILCCRKSGVHCAVIMPVEPGSAADVAASGSTGAENVRGGEHETASSALFCPAPDTFAPLSSRGEPGHAGDVAASGSATKSTAGGSERAVLGSVARGASPPNNNSTLPTFKDPADILKECGNAYLKHFVKNVILDFEYLLARGTKIFGAAESQGKAKAVAFLFPFLDVVDSEVERSLYVTRIGDAYGTDPESVLSDFKKWKKGQWYGQRNDQKFTQGNEGIKLTDELYLLTTVCFHFARHSEFWLEVRKTLKIEEFSDPNAKELYIVLEECYRTETFDAGELLDKIKNETLKNFIAGKMNTDEFLVNPDRLVLDGIRCLEEKKIATQRQRLITQIKSAQDKGLDLDDLLEEKMHLDARFKELKGV